MNEVGSGTLELIISFLPSSIVVGDWEPSAQIIHETSFVLDAIFDPQLDIAMKEEPSWLADSNVQMGKVIYLLFGRTYHYVCPSFSP